jgi:Fe-S-cluster containining protein
MGSSICDICSNKCFGIDGYDGSCCSIEDRDYIIGKITDTDEFIERLQSHLGRSIRYEDIFIDFEAGSQIFPDKSTWQNPENYPALRVNFHHPKLPCIFYNTALKFCTVHDIRPKTCSNYFCDYLSEQIDPKEGQDLQGDTFEI